jgi:hypothetical protein
VRFALREEQNQQTNNRMVDGSRASYTEVTESATFKPLQDMFGARVTPEAIRSAMAQHACDLQKCVDALLACAQDEDQPSCSTSHNNERESDQTASKWHPLPDDCKALIVFKLSSREVAALASACRDMLRFVEFRRSKINLLNMNVALCHVKDYVACHPNASQVSCFSP